MKYTKLILLSFALLALPLVAAAQTDEPQQKSNKSEIKVNKLDVIYEEEEYKGVVIDRRNDKETESYMYQAPFLFDDDDVDDDEEGMPNIYTLDDEGVESEDDILLEGFDTAAIHLPKFDVDNIERPIMIRLRDNARGEKFTWPTPWTARPSSHFGPRWRRFHYGLDLALPTGEPIYAAFDGIVRISKYNKSYGNLVVVRHFNGLETYYAHLSQRDVESGDTVRAGQVIALCGNTGRSYGSHLHFEVRYMGKAMNPEYIIDCTNHKLLSDEIVLHPGYFNKKGSSHYSPSPGDIARVNDYAGTAANNKSTVAENQLRDPSKPKPQTTHASSGAKYYKVRSGDNLSKIAKRNGTTVRKLCQLNKISETTVLQIGRKLRVR